MTTTKKWVQDALKNVRSLIAEERYEEALRALDERCATDHDALLHPMVHIFRGKCHLSVGAADYEARGDVAARNRRFELAEKAFMQAITATPGGAAQPAAWQGVAALCSHRGAHALAHAALLRLLALTPEAPGRLGTLRRVVEAFGPADAAAADVPDRKSVV
eukprot:TRINITY_DN36463_c0_g1_i1.p1 TRINITY_DN36463_c0_g1~~TRINITY_DN36463_c0_g1_i1.p1  ORF type:complete len:162 (+),score=24.97 TRINITY_DN36463_c0_g1_i1:231-716(+)